MVVDLAENLRWWWIWLKIYGGGGFGGKFTVVVDFGENLPLLTFILTGCFGLGFRRGFGPCKFSKLIKKLMRGDIH